MSVQAMTWVFEHSTSTGTARLVMLAIADNHGDRGAWPAIETIAEKARVSKRTVHRAIAAAVRSGELEVAYKAGPWGTNVYRLTQCQSGTVPLGSLDPAIAVTQDPAIAVTPEPKEPKEPNAESKTRAADAASVDKPSLAVGDRLPYFLHKLQGLDTSWGSVTIPACVALAKKFDMDSVSVALSFAAQDPPTLTGSAYGWLDATTRGLYEAKVGVA